MIAADDGVPHLIKESGLRGVGRPETRRGRRQDKRTGTFQVHVVDGVGECPGPGLERRAYLAQLAFGFSGLAGTFCVGRNNGG